MKVLSEKSSFRQVPDWESGSLSAESLREAILARDRQEGTPGEDITEGRTGLAIGIGLAVWLVATVVLLSFLSFWEGIHEQHAAVPGGVNGLHNVVDMYRLQDRPQEEQ